MENKSYSDANKISDYYAYIDFASEDEKNGIKIMNLFYIAVEPLSKNRIWDILYFQNNPYCHRTQHDFLVAAKFLTPENPTLAEFPSAELLMKQMIRIRAILKYVPFCGMKYPQEWVISNCYLPPLDSDELTYKEYQLFKEKCGGVK